MKAPLPRNATAGAVEFARPGVIETDIPPRLDRLGWSRFHWLVIVALGITWVLDGLEVTLVGSLSSALTQPGALGLSTTEIGLAASAYLIGAILGALGFGYLTDRFGRKRLFVITVGVYAIATAATGLSWNFLSFALFRLLTGAGIGGEYSAINSAIQELVPARYRGRTDLAVNGSFWAGAILGALAAVVALDPALLPLQIGWRVPFLLGGILALIVIVLRRFIPESPRWLMTHGRLAEAEAIVAQIEARAGAELPRPATLPRLRLRAHHRHRLGDVLRMLFRSYPRRTLVGLVLMAAQAFLYNAIFFTYGLILSRFYGVADSAIGGYIIAFALANWLGPLVLGPLFDTIGRKPMIALSYGLSGAMLAVTALLFNAEFFTAVTQTGAWMAIFFVASAAASAAYLTVSESFPLETRALVIAFFYAFGTAIGGVAGPALFGALIETGERRNILWGYFIGAAFMLIAAIVEAFLGVAAERRPLEEIAAPLSSAEDEGGTS